MIICGTCAADAHTQMQTIFFRRFAGALRPCVDTLEKYAHPVETVDFSDIEMTAQLIFDYVMSGGIEK